MNYEIKEDRIEIYDLEDFNILQILECGQIFRFKFENGLAHIYSKDNYAKVETFENKVVVSTLNVEYFEKFFDLKTDYSVIKKELRKDASMLQAIDFGSGIRILNNDLFEMIVSFIISANNNIPRIKKSIERLCEKFGTNKGEYFAFPTLNQLKQATVEDFVLAGLGYRASQLHKTLQILTNANIEEVKKQTEQEQFKFLLSLSGVGPKVANCIMLFGLSRKDVFPVDTWINKVYNNLTGKIENDRNKIAKELTDRFKDLSGYAQQYLFYYYRENKLS